MNRPLMRSQGTQVAVGLAMLGGAFLVLWDAYDGRGRGAPWPLSAVLPW